MQDEPKTTVTATPPTGGDVGILAFSAFHLALGHGSTAENWKALPAEIQGAWTASAKAVLAHHSVFQ